MGEWVLKQFDTVVDSFLSSCNSKMQAKVIARLDFLSDKGNLLGRPFTAKLTDDLYELRAQSGRLEARLVFFYQGQKTIIFVYAFFKSGSQVPARYLETAAQRKNRIIDGEGATNAIRYIN